MKKSDMFYVEPAIRAVRVRMENGFAATGGFEQPELGGEDDL